MNPEDVPPEPALIARGFQPPFKSWFSKINDLQLYENELAEFKKTHDPLPADLDYMLRKGMEHSVDLIVKKIEEHGPFDGFLTFSQGGVMFRFFYYYT